MNNQSSFFTSTAHAKWILAGEHAVLRDSPALVFPLLNKTIALTYHPTSDPLQVDFDSPYGETLLLIFWGLLETALEKVGQARNTLNGKFHIKNSIPMGAGMGFSAALCVVITRWLIWKKWLFASQLFQFARDLENHFHSNSSGVDIAGAMHETGMLFYKDGRCEAIQAQWQPYFYLSYNASLSVTAHCVQRVAALWKKDLKHAQHIDNCMKTSALEALKALRTQGEPPLDFLVKALQLAHDCFASWQLIPSETTEHIQRLITHGALAAKPTGAGNGGYIVSLWATPPQSITDLDLHAVRCV